MNASGNGVRTLSSTEMAPLLSPYLMGGYREDELIFDEIRVTRSSITAACSVGRYFGAGESPFHLTVPIVFVAVAQLAIIFGHLDNGLTKKESDVYVRDISLKCRRVVRRTSGLGMDLTLGDRRRIADGVYYAGDISVDEGSFVGRGTFLLRLKPPGTADGAT